MLNVPNSAKPAVDHIAKANAAWGNAPDWVIALAEACGRTSQNAVAKKLEYSAAVVSTVLSNSYRGDLGRVEEIVRGVLMSETVACPVLGDLARRDCWEWQAKPQIVTSSLRAEMYRACRSGCPFSRIGGN